MAKITGPKEILKISPNNNPLIIGANILFILYKNFPIF